MHHKKKKAKNQRSGCLMCKCWKVNGADHRGVAEKRQDERDHIDRKELQMFVR